MPAGCHSLEFEITIPDTLPGSFEGRYGFVRHWLDCVVDRPGAAELRTSRALSVICDSDLNRHPAVMKSVRHHEHVVLCCGCFRPDQYDVSCQLPYTGYVPGETIFPDVRVRNFTRTTILLTVRLVMVTTYRAKNRVKVTKNVVVEEQKDVLRTEVTRWEPALQVPALPPTGLGGCHVIDVRYFLQVDVSSRGWGWQGVAFQDEIKIGTIPLRHVANVRHAEVRLPLQLMASHKALLVDQPALRMLAHAPVGNGSCLLSAKAPSSDGKVTSDVESGSPLAHEPPRDVMLVDPGSRTRATSIISTSSHWSFHPHTPMGVPRLHPGFLKKLAGKRNGKRGSKGFVPKLPTIYSV
ncbi:hypothetical protein C0Q70_20734 [Pomacea canaliculata]|uniref:Arrestin C-terminal-like domain-containing protein n=2 Tax=Pomacea canaliculata TaxID=400727 RepID=A0A2T7NGF0_POMCA|nr:hypothetical protein C0Q70_20734 [Pomacea canaliculata]